MNDLNVLKFAISLAFVFINVANADTYKTYDGAWAAKYALKNYDQPYPPSKGNPFQNFEKRDSAGNLIPDGGNCTNFVSQALIAGFIQNDSMKKVFENRYEFDTDYSTANYTKAWYYRNDSQRGPAWSGAPKLFEYADKNIETFRGVHFKKITSDSSTSFMDYNSVRVGDIIFADWGRDTNNDKKVDSNADGTIDHSMIVTSYDYWTQFGYNKIQVTYQSKNKTRRLGDINEENTYIKNGKKIYAARFYVYRPTNYNPDGK
ncbi:MAG: amidase domain-containing protein [Proteobacteria bacterium]|nr:amidase domain-containing protein [Pseudomonadota bacterium]